MSAQPGQLRFLPWLRRGLAASAKASAGGEDPRPSVEVTLNVRRSDSVEGLPDSVEDVATTLRLYGPGDVLRLNPAQVIATEPKPFTNDFEPNYLATVTFDAPELPWLFSPAPSPAATDPAGRLLPWLCLVVVRREATEILPAGARPLPTLKLENAAGELPDLAESWAWAHAQIATTAVGGVADALAGPPELTLSRLICPRRLAPRTAYIACVVPAFEAGRQAGLGEKVTAGTEPAWRTPAAGPLELPIYYYWEFTTGAAGDFEALVRRLVPSALGPEVGMREMDISKAGPGLPELTPGAPGSVLGLEGALRSPPMLPSPWSDPARAEFQDKLKEQLEASPGDAETVVTPPVYGGVHAGETSIGASSPTWLRELNLDPRHRAAAAFGVRVVQEQQEQLMASAWDQAGELEGVNQLLREAQLARAVAGSLREKRLEHLSATAVLRVTEPVHARIKAPPAVPVVGSLLGGIRRSVFPEAAVSPPFRRVLRPQGPLVRRIGEEKPVTELVGQLAAGSIRMPIVEVVGGTVEFDKVGEEVVDSKQRLSGLNVVDDKNLVPGWKRVEGVDGFHEALVEPPVLGSTPSPIDDVSLVMREPLPPGDGGTDDVTVALLRRDDVPGDVQEPEGPSRRRLGGINGRFREAAKALQDYLARPAAGEQVVARRKPELPVEAIAPELVSAKGANAPLDPEHTVPDAVLPLITFPDGPRPPGAAALVPEKATPRFPQPMYESLRALSQDLLLPGAEHIPPDTVGLVVGNPRFIEAYMVGLNYELGREFFWRGLLADPRATFFQQFWDVRGRDPAAQDRATDIPPIATWERERQLGGNATRVGGHDMLVLLVRGELLRRYPTATIYAVKAESRHKLGTEERYPEFRGTLEPDLTFVAFDLRLDEVRGSENDPGWFFVIQEQAVETRFGFDEPVGTGSERFGGEPGHWRELTWGHFVADEQAFEALTHVAVVNNRLGNRTLPLTPPDPNKPNEISIPATWGMNAAHTAQIALQPPARVAIHASQMLRTVESALMRITAVQKEGDHILAVGGVDTFGEPWRMSEAEAIAAIRTGTRHFFVEQPEGDPLEIVISSDGDGREFLKTRVDGDRPDTLLALPGFPI